MITNEQSHNELAAIKSILTDGLSGVELERNLLIYKSFVLSINLALNNLPSSSGSQIQSDWAQTDALLVDFIKNKPTTFPPTAHTHDDRYYTETEIDSALSTKSNTGHTHTASNITDFQANVSSNTDVAANTAARHTHSNKLTLDAITEAFTTALKTAYDNAVTWISTNGTSLINHLSNTSNPHNVTKTQVGLSNVSNVDTTTTANITDSLNKRFVTDAKKTVLDNTSNTNTGDETTASIQTKRPLKTVNGESLEGSGNIAVGGGASPTILALEGNIATAANTTPVNLTGMAFDYLANSIYTFDMNMFVSSAAATTGCGFQLDVSTAVTQIGMNFFHQLAATGTLSGGSSVADNVSAGVSSGVLGTGINFVNGKGILITGANPGTAQFMFRSETTAITTCNANSKIIVNKIS